MAAGKQPIIGFLGYGKMAQGLIRGMVCASVTSPEKIHVYDPDKQCIKLAASRGIQTHSSNHDVVAASNIVIIAVKPDIVSVILQEISPIVSPSKLIVSVAAGVNLPAIKEKLGSDTRIVRIMPNIPALICAGVTAIAVEANTLEADVELVETIMKPVGRCVRVKEKLMNAVTGLSGSGPAYCYMMIDALADGGVRVGLPRNDAQLLAAQPLLGAAMMVLETGDHPAVLKDKVCSEGGTTIAGVCSLEKSGLRAALIDAVVSTTERANELSLDTF